AVRRLQTATVILVVIDRLKSDWLTTKFAAPSSTQ
ncbi:hypothetical protein D039_4663B, partial [Vibrio parahaemolyticus EKP-028]